jgi:hypothetical protein
MGRPVRSSSSEFIVGSSTPYGVYVQLPMVPRRFSNAWAAEREAL